KWSAEDRAFVAANFARLSERLNQGEYLFDDEDVARERTKRRLVALLAKVDTPVGRIEIWGGGNQQHTTRCAFLYDAAGDDVYLDVAGRADLAQPVSMFIDASGDDLWSATSPFGLAGALGGAAVVWDFRGDDEYV